MSEGNYGVGWRLVALYDGAGHCTRLYKIDDLNGGNDTLWTRYLFYNGAHQLVGDSTFYDPPFSGRPADEVGKISYSGTAVAKAAWVVWDAGSYQADHEMYFSYYPGGKVKTIIYWSTTFGSPTTMLYVAKDTFGYTPGAAALTFYQTWGLFNGLRSPAYRYEVNRLNAAGYPDSVTVWENGGGYLFPNEGRKVYYDAENNPMRIDYTYLNTSTPNITLQDVFYYEPYTVGIQSASATAKPFTIAPNPTSSRITIHYAPTNTNRQVSLSITNMSGQLVHRELLSLRGTAQDIVLGDEAPPGQYHICLREAGNLLYSGMVVKQ